MGGRSEEKQRKIIMNRCSFSRTALPMVAITWSHQTWAASHPVRSGGELLGKLACRAGDKNSIVSISNRSLVRPYTYPKERQQCWLAELKGFQRSPLSTPSHDSSESWDPESRRHLSGYTESWTNFLRPNTACSPLTQKLIFKQIKRAAF